MALHVVWHVVINISRIPKTKNVNHVIPIAFPVMDILNTTAAPAIKNLKSTNKETLLVWKNVIKGTMKIKKIVIIVINVIQGVRLVSGLKSISVIIARVAL